MTLSVTLNGELKQLQSPCSLTELIEQMQLTGRRIAVEVNQEIVPRSQHASCQLADGDCIEVVQAIGGG